jgi:3-phytase
MNRLFVTSFALLLISCKSVSSNNNFLLIDTIPVKPIIVTDRVYQDPDDPAIWIHPVDLSKSLILGTDKHKTNGGIYVFSLQGKIDTVRTHTGMQRVNNIDIAYGFLLDGIKTDLAVATERDRNRLRIFRLPDMQPVDAGGLEVFQGDSLRLPMGIALYTRLRDGALFAIVGRKDGPRNGYLEQYQLQNNGQGKITGTLIRRFGRYSGKKEIESIAVDNETGYVYYSDEQAGIRKYHADPDKGDEELAFFGQQDFLEDNEGISFYKFSDGTGYILVSDQSRNTFNVYRREGRPGDPHAHARIAVIPVSTQQSDGSELTNISLPGFKGGLFVAMSDDQTFQYYRWSDLARKAGLRVNKRERR